MYVVDGSITLIYIKTLWYYLKKMEINHIYINEFNN